jgi:hypothetical protein
MRNKLAGKSTGKSKSAKYYASNPEARKKKQEYNAKYNKKPSAVKKRVECNAANRKAGTYGNGDGKDMSHTKGGKMVKEKASSNRARQGANGKSTLKGSSAKKKATPKKKKK